MRRYREIFQTVSTLLILSLILPPNAVSLDWSDHRKSSLRPSQEGTQKSGLEEAFRTKVGLEEPPLPPVENVETAEDGVTIPLPSDQTLKVVLPERYRQKGKRLVTVRVDTKLPVYPQEIKTPQDRLVSGGRFNEYWVVTISFEHQGQPAEEHFAFTWSGAGFQWVHPGLTPLFYLATSEENWLDRENIQPLSPFQVLTAKNGYVIEVGKGTFPDGSKANIRLELPRDRYQGRGLHPVVIETQWQENLYLKPDGFPGGGYVVSVVVDPGTPEEQRYRFRFTGDASGFARLEMEELLNEVAQVAAATNGSPGELLDVLLVLYGERYTVEQLKSFVRRFEELNLGELIRRPGGRGGRGRGHIFLDFYFQQAALISQKEERDQETLIEVFLKVAFRDLMKPEIRNQIFDDIRQKLRELEARGIKVDFFQRLEERTRELVEKAMAFQPAHLKTELLPHQAVGSYFLRHHNRTFLGDFTGAGKTIEVLGAMDPEWKIFVASPANLIDTWLKEIEKHMDPKVVETMEIVVLRGGSPEERRRLMESVRHKKRCLVIGSIQSLPRHTPKELEGLLYDLDLLVVDESQFGANYRGEGVRTNAQRAEALQGIPAPRKWYLSATGYGADPEELFATLRALIKDTPEEEQLEFPDDFKRFKKLYPTDQAAGLRYLRALMRPRSLNRQEDEVMERYEDPAVSGVPLAKQGARLPTVVEQPYRELGSYELNEEQVDLLLRMIHNFREFAEWYNQRVPASEQLTERQMNPFLKLDFAFYLLADPKRVGGTTESPLWKTLDDVVEQYLAQGKKGILYTNNIFVTEKILERCREKRINVARIDSTISGFAHDAKGRILKGYFDKEGELVLDPNHPKAKNVDAKTYQRHLFQTDPTIRLIVVGTRAGGIGLDITAAEFMVEVQLPEVYTQERQTDGRPIRVDLKRPRLQVDKIRVAAVFPKGFADRYKGTEYEELAQLFAGSGTPDEILVERLSRGKRRFQYVMTDLATDEDLDLFDPTSLANAIPGFNEDPTIEQYFASLASRRLRQTLEIFLPLYLRAQTHEKRQEVLRLAELFFRTGQLEGIEALIGLLFDEDETVLRLVSSLGEISNKYARIQWVSRVVQLITEDLPANEVRLKDIAEAFDFLMEEAPFLILPLYEVTKGFENGQAIDHLHALLAEISESYRHEPQRKRFLYHVFVLWLLAVDPAARDALKEVLQLHGETLTDSKIPLERRLELTERLLRTMSFSRTKEILLTQARVGDVESLKEALDQAVLAAAESTFGFSKDEPQRLMPRFPAVLTALQIQRVLQNQPHLSLEFNRINEVLRHAAQGDYETWRNQQEGERFSGKRVTYLEDQPEFWRVFTRGESVTLQGLPLGYEQHREQLVKVVNQLMEMLMLEESRHVGEVDGDWVQQKFTRWSTVKPEVFRRNTGHLRKSLAEVHRTLRSGGTWDDLKREEQEICQGEGLTQQARPLSQAIEERMADYGHLQEWILLVQRLQALREAPPAPGQLAEIRAEVSKLIGRARRRKAHKTADHLELLPDLLERLRQQVRYDKIAVELTTDPSLMIERGMLQPRLVDCFNCYADPEHTSTLADDLGSRNKILAIVRDAEGQILARSIVKVKRLEDGTPVVFPERPLYMGGYDFEPEILEAIRQTKLKELTPFGTHLAREPTDAEKGQGLSLRVFDTGGYSDREYIEPLFGIRDRVTRRGPIYHSAILVNGPAVGETKEEAVPLSINFLGGIGYQGMRPEAFVKLLQARQIDVVIDVRDFPGGRRTEFSRASLEDTLQQAGIRYRHVRALGAPKGLRDTHRLGQNDQEFLRSYRTHVDTHPEVQRALESLRPLLHGKRVCLLCYEANPHQCHRLVIAEELSKQATITEPIIDLNAPLLPLIEPKEKPKTGLEEESRAAAKEYTMPFLGGLGYQGLDIEGFVRLLQNRRIQLVVDVREVASSRKPGFSKTSLERALNRAGIQYLHARALGTPKSMRDDHRLGRNDQAFRKAYAKFLKTRRKELEALLPEMNGKRVCLVCYEADPNQCHRLVIAQELLKQADITQPIVDLRDPHVPLFKPEGIPNSGLEELKPLSKDEIAVSVPGLVTIFVNSPRAVKPIQKAIADANPADSNSATLHGIPFTRRLRSNHVVWAFPKRYISAVAQHFGLIALSPLEDLQSDEIALSKASLNAIFINGENAIESIRWAIAAANPANADAVTLRGIPFTRRKNRSWRVWSFPRDYAPQFAKQFGLTLRTPLKDLQPDEIAVSQDGLNASFISGGLATRAIQQAIVAENPADADHVVLHGIPFHRRVKTTRVSWAFPKRYASTVAYYFDLTPRPPLEDLQPDEVAVAIPSFESLFLNGQRAAQPIQQAIAEANPQDGDTVTLRGIPFVRRTSGKHVVWAFPKDRLHAFAQKFHLTVRPLLANLQSTEIAVTKHGLDAILVNGWDNASQIQQSITAANPTNADTVALHGIPFTKRKSGTNIVWSFPKEYIPQFAQAFGLTSRPEVLMQPDERLRPLAEMAAAKEGQPAEVKPQERKRETGLEEGQLHLYVNAKIRNGRLVETGRLLWRGEKLQRPVFQRLGLLQGSPMALSGVRTYSHGAARKDGRRRLHFSLFGYRYGIRRYGGPDRPSSLKLLVVINPKTLRPQAAYDEARGEEVYRLTAEKRQLKLYLGATLEKGHLVDPGPPFWTGRRIDRRLLQSLPPQPPKRIVMDGIPALPYGGSARGRAPSLRFYLLGKSYLITVPSKEPLRSMLLLVEVNPLTFEPIVAYERTTGVEVYRSRPAVRTLNEMRLYLDPQIHNGRMGEAEAPFWVGRQLKHSVFQRIPAQQVKRVWISHVPTRAHGSGLQSGDRRLYFSLFGGPYPTTRIADPSRPLELLVVVDAATLRPLTAYDQGTGEKVYDGQDQILIYLDPQLSAGKLMGPAQHFRQMDVVSSPLWKDPKIQAAHRVGFLGVSTHWRKRPAALHFSLGNRRYPTRLAFDPSRSVRLLVLADPKTRQPVAAYDQETGEQVYPRQRAVEPLGSDEISVTPNGFKSVFAGSVSAAKRIQTAIAKVSPTDTKEVTIDQIQFFKRRRGSHHIVWAFRKEDAPAIAERFDLSIRPTFDFLHSDEVAVSLHGLEKLFVNGTKALETLSGAIAAANKANADAIELGGIPFRRRRTGGGRVVWSFPRQYLLQISQHFGLTLRPEADPRLRPLADLAARKEEEKKAGLEEIKPIQPDEVAVSEPGLQEIFRGDHQRFRDAVKAIQAVLASISPVKTKTVRLRGIPFIRRRRGPISVWAFPRASVPDFGKEFGLPIRRDLQLISEDEIALTAAGLRQIFRRGEAEIEQATKEIRAAVVAGNPTDANTVILDGVPFTRRTTRGYQIVWAFPQEHAPTVAQRFHLPLRSPLSPIQTGEVSVSRSGFEKAFAHSRKLRRVIQTIQTTLATLASQEEDKVTLDGIPFSRRVIGGGNVIWAFPQEHAPTVARRFGLSLPLMLERPQPDEIAVSHFGLDGVFVNAQKAVKILQPAIAQANPINADTVILDGIPFTRRKFMNKKAVWAFPNRYLPIVAERFGFALQSKERKIRPGELQLISEDEIAVSIKGLQATFVHSVKAAQTLRAALAAENPTDADSLLLGGVLFTRRRIGERTVGWAFSKEDAPTVAQHFGFTLRRSLEKPRPDEIQVSHQGFWSVFRGGSKKFSPVLDTLKVSLDAARPTDADTVTLDGVPFTQRLLEGGGVVWVFPKTYAPAIAQRFGLTLRPAVDERLRPLADLAARKDKKAGLKEKKAGLEELVLEGFSRLRYLAEGA